jgi:hypothetical protein
LFELIFEHFAHLFKPFNRAGRFLDWHLGKFIASLFDPILDLINEQLIFVRFIHKFFFLLQQLFSVYGAASFFDGEKVVVHELTVDLSQFLLLLA